MVWCDVWVVWGFRSRINGDVGGRTQMASIICAGVILVATFFLLPWLYFLPKCVLGSMCVPSSSFPLVVLVWLTVVGG